MNIYILQVFRFPMQPPLRSAQTYIAGHVRIAKICKLKPRKYWSGKVVPQVEKVERKGQGHAGDPAGSERHR